MCVFRRLTVVSSYYLIRFEPESSPSRGCAPAIPFCTTRYPYYNLFVRDQKGSNIEANKLPIEEAIMA